ncbi:MAG: hypothetical protein DMF73_13500 [Acidobacteria bacterium]|nr:MAG: hypothetical protein DMF73_13500 [Acidobacteriota bacterium]
MINGLSSGTRLGRYEIRSQIGAGGMGEVYLAQDTKLDRKVALKILPADVVANKDRMRRFVQEAKSAAALNHPNIAHVYEIDEVDGQHFIAMEFVDGQTLRLRLKGTGLRLGEALDVTTQIASALAAAHRAGIIHRDLKPENVMLTPEGYVKVLDFGLAKLTEHPAANSAVSTLIDTEPGMIIGTAQYMSPEQARGLEMDARTDIWSLGVVLYEMITGHIPFEGATKSDMIASILDREPRPLTSHSPDLPSELWRIVKKALRKDREERYQTIKDLGLDVKNLRREMELEPELDCAKRPPFYTLRSSAGHRHVPGATSRIERRVYCQRDQAPQDRVPCCLGSGNPDVGRAGLRNLQIRESAECIFHFNEADQADEQWQSRLLGDIARWQVCGPRGKRKRRNQPLDAAGSYVEQRADRAAQREMVSRGNFLA